MAELGRVSFIAVLADHQIRDAQTRPPNKTSEDKVVMGSRDVLVAALHTEAGLPLVTRAPPAVIFNPYLE